MIGFSVQDKVIVLGQVRENISRRGRESSERVSNRSILESIPRSLTTLLIAMFVLLAVIIFGGETLRLFVTTMLIGMLGATYSSIFIAVPLLVSWEGRADRRSARAVT